MIRPHPRSTLFPYTTLFRSRPVPRRGGAAVSLAGAVERGRHLAAWIAARRGRTALAWAAATFLVLAALAGGPGVARDEARVLERSDAALRAPGAVPAEAPPFAAEAAAAARALAVPLGLSHLRAARLGTALLGA